MLRRGLSAGLLATLAAACGRPQDRDAAAPDAGGGPRGGVALLIVGIVAADLDRSLRFYRRLGLDVPTSVDGDAYRLRTADDHVIFWETPRMIRSFDPTWQAPPRGDRRIVLEFGFTSPQHLDDTFVSLVSAGAPPRLRPFDQGGGIRYAIVEDPDGNQVSLRYPAA